MHVGHADIEMFGHPLLDFLDGDPPVTGAQQVVQDLLTALQRDLPADQRRMRGDAVQGAFQFAYA